MSIVIRLIRLFVRLSNTLQALVLLLLRLWMAKVFLSSGLVKISDFSNTVALFESEYAVPFIPPYFAAVSATFFELTCPILLTLGLGARFACLPLLMMTAVIQFTYDQNIQHAYWAMLLLVIFTFGAGKLSIDHLIRRKLGY